jgi:hypothetical protein
LGVAAAHSFASNHYEMIRSEFGHVLGGDDDDDLGTCHVHALSPTSFVSWGAFHLRPTCRLSSQPGASPESAELSSAPVSDFNTPPFSRIQQPLRNLQKSAVKNSGGYHCVQVFPLSKTLTGNRPKNNTKIRYQLTN